MKCHEMSDPFTGGGGGGGGKENVSERERERGERERFPVETKNTSRMKKTNQSHFFRLLI